MFFRVAAIEFDPNDPFSIIGHPSREYLWILSRTPTMEPDQYERVLEQIESHSYTLDRLNRTPQPPEPSSAKREPGGQAGVSFSIKRR
ncbi:MAG: lipocalin family protein [Deltaproteobacteria bacterium]|nr:lipocalin family protein [Deltaproteobacteria bacterium]MBW2578621.1 lipocalin family protein [Deltaproteobacteria bacterium]MBW2693772.1 lipocalin family protein [Deltaproteobacteria bacterium]